MDITASLSVLAGTLGILMGASPLLQAMRAHRRRSSADISMPFLALLWIGGAAWLAYGIALGNIAMMIANTVGVDRLHYGDWRQPLLAQRRGARRELRLGAAAREPARL